MDIETPRNRDLLLALHKAAVTAALPAICLPPYLPAPPKGRLVIMAIGKAAASMSAAAEAHYATHFPHTHLEGLALTRYSHSHPTGHIEVIEAAHPIPDEAGVEGAKHLLALAQGLGPDDLALVLLSGGGSALATLPVSGMTLEAKRALTAQLLASGAPIGEINCIRKHYSRIKGGRLAEALAPAPSLTLAISDVAGDAPDIIASGPTSPDPTNCDDALAIAKARGIALPIPPTETPKPGDPCFARARFSQVASGSTSLEAAARLAQTHGYDIVNLGDRIEGEARTLARQHAELARQLQTQGRRAIILSGGEANVTFDSASPAGTKGGPNQEYALALALALNGAPGISAIAADTDGIDGGSGSASDPAGALIFSDTLRRAGEAGLDPKLFLRNHDSGHFFERLGDLVFTGPSFTNVNDFRAILVEIAP